MQFNIHEVRQQFPILEQSVDGNPLIYLDNAGTTQKPVSVLQAMEHHLTTQNSNVHRGMHALAERATVAFEEARACVQHFLNASRPEEILFTKSCTESLNLVARSWGDANLSEGDTVVLSILEHHSNMVPWLQLKERKGIHIEWIGIDDHGAVSLSDLERILTSQSVKLVSITGQSNVLGVRPPIKEIVPLAHAAGALVCVDAGQLVSHAQVDVQEIDCDFLTFSGHKLYGPTGIGVLYGKREHLESMPPFLGGGMMIENVRRESFTSAGIPQKFEAGTPPITEAIGLKAAIDWLQQFAWEDIEEHEQKLLSVATEELATVSGLTLYPPSHQLPTTSPHSCLSFTIDSTHPHDITDILGQQGICLRAGHHCTQPLHEHLGVNASIRLSVGIYNTTEEIRMVAPALESATAVLRG